MRSKVKGSGCTFLKLGIIGFEVRCPLYDARGSGSEKKWLEEQHFLDLIEPLI
jgi:hypothetical protein